GGRRPWRNREGGGFPRSAAAHERNQLTRLDGEGHRLEDVTPPGVLADADGVDAGPDGSLGPRQRRRAGRGHGVRGMKRELCHEVPPWVWPASFGRYGHRRDIGATTLGANLERSWRRGRERAHLRAPARRGWVRAVRRWGARPGSAWHRSAPWRPAGLFPGCAGFPAPWAWRPLSSRPMP